LNGFFVDFSASTCASPPRDHTRDMCGGKSLTGVRGFWEGCLWKSVARVPYQGAAFSVVESLLSSRALNVPSLKYSVEVEWCLYCIYIYLRRYIVTSL
jgi:hypothetical protein